MVSAQVELRKVTTTSSSTTSDAQGAFSFPELPAGNYAVRVRWHNQDRYRRENC